MKMMKEISRAAGILPNVSSLYQYNGTSWLNYSLDADARLVVVKPPFYDKIGSDNISSPDIVLPKYLSEELPLAIDGDKAVVIYKGPKGYAIKEFTYDQRWIEKTISILQTTVFTVGDDKKITAQEGAYLSSTFLGDEAGFEKVNVNLNGLVYVWINDSKYGWKASAHKGNVNYATESWIVSPEISLAKAISPVLTFEEVVNYINTAKLTDLLSIMVSTDYTGDVSKATWTELTVPNHSKGSSYDWVNVGNIDLKNYNKKTIRIAFKYTSTVDTAPTWEIRNLSIKEGI